MSMKTDLLNIERINSLPQPLFIRLCGDRVLWPLDHIDVETGLLKFDVCGLLQRGHIGEVVEFVDADGKHHDPDTFYSDWLPEEGTNPNE